jgi:hypothetical protein
LLSWQDRRGREAIGGRGFHDGTVLLLRVVFQVFRSIVCQMHRQRLVYFVGKVCAFSYNSTKSKWKSFIQKLITWTLHSDVELTRNYKIWFDLITFRDFILNHFKNDDLISIFFF